MALNFPSSPTDGQVFNNFVYSSAKGAWNAKPLTGQKSVTSATAPSAPSAGDQWYNTNDGNLYVYYTDVDGSQWVQVKSDATLSSTLGNRVTALETYPSGLTQLSPASVVVASGSASISATGLVAFTGSSSLSLNGLFTSAYTNYRVIFSTTNSSNGQALYVRFRTAGVDKTINYWGAGLASTFTGSLGSNYAQNNGSFGWIGHLGTGITKSVVDVFPDSPTSSFTFNAYSAYDSKYEAGGFENPSTPLPDGITFFTSAGNLTGTLKVYGYR